MKKLTILVDMDDTIENLLEEWVSILNERYSRYVVTDDIRSWKLTDSYPGLTEMQVYGPLHTEELWKNVKPKWDAVFYLKLLKEEGHDIYVTTSSNFNTIKVKATAILERYFPFISWEHVIVASRKQMIRGDVMVDDGPHNLIDGEYERILMTAPHNRDFPAELHNMTRANNWCEVYEIIRALAEDEPEANT